MDQEQIRMNSEPIHELELEPDTIPKPEPEIEIQRDPTKNMKQNMKQKMKRRTIKILQKKHSTDTSTNELWKPSQKTLQARQYRNSYI